MDLLLIEAKKGADLSDLDIRYEVDTFMFEVINLFYFILNDYTILIKNSRCFYRAMIPLQVFNLTNSLKFYLILKLFCILAAMMWFLYIMGTHPEHQVSAIGFIHREIIF